VPTDAHDDRDSGQYFAPAPDVAEAPVEVDVVLPDLAFTMTTDRGVFSRGRLDAGTSLLLRTALPLAQDGHLLDLGCGAGAIALTMAQRSPRATVWAVDVNARARSLTAANATRLGLANVVVAAPEDLPDDLVVTTLWSNPPIRIGKAALHELLVANLRRVSADGTAAQVVQKHLGADSLQRWLESVGHPMRRVASKSGYRVLASAP
jgi:16S rRNA (guanine1207-N2)-methyltransferase